MSKNAHIEKSFEIAKERYNVVGVDVEKTLQQLEQLSISIHCWQTDDVIGFENLEKVGGGGIESTGNYPGRARTIAEVRSDIEEVLKLIGGRHHRFNLHESYGEFGNKVVERNETEPKYYTGWEQWAKEQGLKIDFNSTSFGHLKSGSLTLANPDKSIRDFWIEHTKRCRWIADEIGKNQGDPSIFNVWVHDGSKDLTVNRLKYRELLTDSLDQIFEKNYTHEKDAIEAKLFGIGLESYTVGSYDYYVGYGVKHQKLITLDTGHYHISENIADKISSLLLFVPELMLHVSRPVRWDSDHVTLLTDDIIEIAKEIVRADALDRVHVGLDFFDGSINRVGAYVIGIRATQKAFLQAFLEPLAKLREYEANGQFFERLALLEETKGLPWNAVWDYFCEKNNVPVGEDYITAIEKYEKNVVSFRK